jgi:hypothetical protein
MDRIRFVSKAALATLFVLFIGKPSAEAGDDEGFTMSGGALLGSANGTQGA